MNYVIFNKSISLLKVIKSKIPFFYKPKYSIKKVYNSKSLQKRASKSAIVAHFDPDGFFDPVFIHYLRSLKELDFDVYVCSTSPFLVKEEIDKCLNFAVKVYHRKNKGLDFASWASVIEKELVFDNYQEMLLTNDSILGPFSDLSLIFDKIPETHGLFGLTLSEDISSHIQSYFLYINNISMEKSYLHNFFSNIRTDLVHSEVVHSYEVGLSKLVLKNEGKLRSYICNKELMEKSIGYEYSDDFIRGRKFDVSIILGYCLVERLNFPFIKRSLFSKYKIRNEKKDENFYSFINDKKLREQVRDYIKRYNNS